MADKRKRQGLLKIIGPGLLVAATGVGAGDLATGALTGTKLGLTVLWAVLVGALIKFILNEGLARWQMATGQTVLEGAILRPRSVLSRIVQSVFLVYLLMWSYFVASALMSACGVATHAMLPLLDSGGDDKILYGMAHSVLGVVLVLGGGYKLIEKVMSVCIAVMFVTVVSTAVMVGPDWLQVVSGLTTPVIPQGGLVWTVALAGGVGGTLTVLCYGYWIREKGRSGPDAVRTCRIDLAVAYAFTAIFGVSMVIIGSTITVEGKGAKLIVTLADKLLASPLGAGGRWVFLIGAWCALFSSLLGVWQAVPYIFADFCNIARSRSPERMPGPTVEPVNTRQPAYRAYLLTIAIVPMVGLFFSFTQVQRVYAVFGAMFMPLLAMALLFLNTRQDWVGAKMKNRLITNIFLVATVLLFLAAALFMVWKP
ncbi:MAG: Nramp family divalent metal transporter [Phycisphaerae bacterium]|jgi:Mn2+/Fe2+ NRAMP family transporter|nr:Nramp family divalent metal transporter [Phycisphaerae bacterium]